MVLIPLEVPEGVNNCRGGKRRITLRGSMTLVLKRHQLSLCVMHKVNTMEKTMVPYRMHRRRLTLVGWHTNTCLQSQQRVTSKQWADIHVGWAALTWSREKISASPSLCGCTVAWLKDNNRCVQILVQTWSNLYSTAFPGKTDEAEEAASASVY